jgi:LPS O-antigen subunit length determinant protein (WzzB/FepE family)
LRRAKRQTRKKKRDAQELERMRLLLQEKKSSHNKYAKIAVKLALA